MPNIAFKRPELTARLPEYDIIRDCVAGSIAVKAATIKYLPRPNNQDKSRANLARYNNYIGRAVFYNVTRLLKYRTLCNRLWTTQRAKGLS